MKFVPIWRLDLMAASLRRAIDRSARVDEIARHLDAGGTVSERGMGWPVAWSHRGPAAGLAERLEARESAFGSTLTLIPAEEAGA